MERKSKIYLPLPAHHHHTQQPVPLRPHKDYTTDNIYFTSAFL